MPKTPQEFKQAYDKTFELFATLQNAQESAEQVAATAAQTRNEAKAAFDAVVNDEQAKVKASNEQVEVARAALLSHQEQLRLEYGMVVNLTATQSGGSVRF